MANRYVSVEHVLALLQNSAEMLPIGAKDLEKLMDVVANMLPSKSKDFVGAPASVVENKRLDGAAQSLKRKALDLEDLDKDDYALLEEASAESLKRKALEEEEASTKFTESRACKRYNLRKKNKKQHTSEKPKRLLSIELGQVVERLGVVPANSPQRLHFSLAHSPPLSARSQELQQVIVESIIVYQQERHWEAGADPPQLDQSQHLEISSMLPTLPGKARNAVRSDGALRTPASTRPCFRAEKNLIARMVFPCSSTPGRAVEQQSNLGGTRRTYNLAMILETMLFSPLARASWLEGSEDGMAWTRALEGEISMTNASPKSGNQALCCSKSSPTYIQEFESRSSADEKLGCGAVNNPP
ncbi:hypothetical protein SELMODRAFT_421924 [Selaginella moellendorffii]|uniref:Uncharacterized protein n=1 Tax=Selaginella moellendorffii TaxID=88036 RepID=D8SGS7_SELML|nr:hypothetical protein SELMODRAFT_421924 [Selaginella moellendorffii]